MSIVQSKSYHVFTKSELVLYYRIVAVNLPDEIVRGLREAVRGLFKDGWIRDAR